MMAIEINFLTWGFTLKPICMAVVIQLPISSCKVNFITMNVRQHSTPSHVSQLGLDWLV